ncbi:MAG TPA: hypothetical protein VF723_10310 [Pyrinomonadaceae bacterium]|jgi:hypothetical protein
MTGERKVLRLGLLILGCLLACTGVRGQQRSVSDDSEFGPVVRAYLGYLRSEQEVVDDRASRHEVSATYYRRNSNRIRALRQMAIRLARETRNDYLPELEAAARDELGNLFEHPPKLAQLRAGEVYNNTFRFLGVVRAAEIFYLFARLDPYEQAELMEKAKAASQASPPAPAEGEMTSRPRRVAAPR